MWNIHNKHLYSVQCVMKNKDQFYIPSTQVSNRRGHYQGENAKTKTIKIFFEDLGRDDTIKMKPKVFTYITLKKNYVELNFYFVFHTCFLKMAILVEKKYLCEYEKYVFPPWLLRRSALYSYIHKCRSTTAKITFCRYSTAFSFAGIVQQMNVFTRISLRSTGCDGCIT